MKKKTDKKKAKKSLKDVFSKKVKITKEDIEKMLVKALEKKKEPEELTEKVEEKTVSKKKPEVKDNMSLAYGAREAPKSVDYGKLFDYMGTGTDGFSEYLSKMSGGKSKSFSYEAISREEREEITKKLIWQDMMGGVQEYVSEDDKKKYKLWMQMNPLMWKMEFSMTNKYGAKDILF